MIFPKCMVNPSSKVDPVASCQRAMPSVTTYLRNAPTITAHNMAVPRMLPAKLPVARSPAPTPVAAVSMPGLITMKNCLNLFIIKSFECTDVEYEEYHTAKYPI